MSSDSQIAPQNTHDVLTVVAAICQFLAANAPEVQDKVGSNILMRDVFDSAKEILSNIGTQREVLERLDRDDPYGTDPTLSHNRHTAYREIQRTQAELFFKLVPQLRGIHKLLNTKDDAVTLVVALAAILKQADSLSLTLYKLGPKDDGIPSRIIPNQSRSGDIDSKSLGTDTGRLAEEATRLPVSLDWDLLSKLRDNQARLNEHQAKLKKCLDVYVSATAVSLGLSEPQAKLKHINNPSDYSLPMFWDGIRDDFQRISTKDRSVIAESGYDLLVKAFQHAYDQAMLCASRAGSASAKGQSDRIEQSLDKTRRHAIKAFNAMNDIVDTSETAVQEELATVWMVIQLVSSDMDLIRKKMDLVGGTRPSEARTERETEVVRRKPDERGDISRNQTADISARPSSLAAESSHSEQGNVAGQPGTLSLEKGATSN